MTARYRSLPFGLLARHAGSFHLDVLACPRCGGRLRVIATVQDPLAVRAIPTSTAPSPPTHKAPPHPRPPPSRSPAR